MALTKSEISVLINANIYGDPLLGKHVQQFINEVPKQLIDKMFALKSGEITIDDTRWVVGFSKQNRQLNIEKNYFKPGISYIQYTLGFVMDDQVPSDTNFHYQTKFFEIIDEFMKIDLENKGTKTTNYVITKLQLTNKHEISTKYSPKVRFYSPEWEEIEAHKFEDKMATIDFKKGNTLLFTSGSNKCTSVCHTTGSKKIINLSKTKGNGLNL